MADKPKVFPNPKHIKPVLDTEIKPSRPPKDLSSPKLPYGYSYYAEPYMYKDEPVDSKKHTDNAPLNNPAVPQENDIREFSKGTNFVPETGLAIVHKGEKIVPAKENMTEHNVSLYRALHNLHKGGLHRALKVEEGKPIPAEKLEKAKNSDSEHIRHMANFAATMSHFKH